MTGWLVGIGLGLGGYLVQDLVVVAALRLVDRLWGDRGIAWVLGRSEDEVARMRRSQPR